MSRRTDFLIVVIVAGVLAALGISAIIFTGPATLTGQANIRKTNDAVLTQIALASSVTAVITATPSESGAFSSAPHATRILLTATNTPIPQTSTPTATPSPNAQDRLATAAARQLLEGLTLTSTAVFQNMVSSMVARHLQETAAAASLTPTIHPTATPLLATLISQRMEDLKTQTQVFAYQATIDGAVNHILTSTAAALPTFTPTPTLTPSLTLTFTPTPTLSDTPQLATKISQFQTDLQNQTATAVFASTVNAAFNLPLTATAAAERQSLIIGFVPLQISNVNQLKPLPPIKAAAKILALAFDPTGAKFASANSDDSITIWDVKSGTALTTLTGFSARLCVAFSPDGQILAYGSSDGTVRLWDLNAKAEKATLNGHNGQITSVAFSPNRKLIATGSANNDVTLWDATTDNEISVLHGHQSTVLSVAFNPDSTLLASGGLDGTVRLWDVNAQSEVNVLKGYGLDVNSVAFSPNGQTLASAHNDGSIHLWKVSTGAQLLVLKGHIGKVTSVVFNADGTLLASGGYDRTVRVWNPASGLSLLTLSTAKEVTSVAFSPDGVRLAGGTLDNTLQLWAVSGAP